MRTFLLVSILLLPAVAAQEAPPAKAQSAPRVPAITAAELESHVRFLASDELLGRPAGSAESVAAARYVAAELERSGLEPGAPDGSFLQPVPLGRAVYDGVPQLVVQMTDGKEEVLLNGRDFSFRARGLPAATPALELRVVPSQDAMPPEADLELALFLDTTPGRSRRWLSGAGPGATGGFGLVLVAGAKGDGESARPSDGRIGLAGAATTVALTLSERWSTAARAGTLARVRFDPRARWEPADDYNVVGVVPGAPPSQEVEGIGELIVFSAHRDHIGVRPTQPGQDADEDRIANGADDDASGCAVLLEVAQALAAGPPPQRTCVFLFVTGEESGLLGSKHYVSAPCFPLEKTVANLNVEMMGMADELAGGAGKPWLTGFERSTLGEELVKLGLGVVADPRPESNFFLRSDNVSFARAGIVAHTFSTGGDNPNYHRPSDEWDTLDYDHMETCAGIVLRAGRALANGGLTPVWKPGEPKLSR